MPRKLMLTPAVLLVVILTAASGRCELKVAGIFGEHMVLQRDAANPLWGWADAGASVRVQVDGGASVTATADKDGAWQVKLAPLPAGGPHAITVRSGRQEVKLGDVLVGEVWLCSGQSNMEMTVSRCINAEAEVAQAKQSQIRHVKIPRHPAGYPEKDVTATWQVCAPETVGGWTACGYFFARKIQQELGVPVGLINSSWGGTLIEPWTVPEGFGAVPELESLHTKLLLTDPHSALYQERLRSYLTSIKTWIRTAETALRRQQPLQPAPPYPAELKPLTEHQQPCALYNGMIRPLAPYTIRGILWYQGESNHRDGKLYTAKTRALVEGWRKLWGQSDLPFYYVQIAPYQYGNENAYILPAFWEAQAAAQEIPNTGMVVINDIGNLRDIHPKNKQEVGRRLALLALAKTYGRTDIEWSGPTLRAMKIEGDCIRVQFDHVGKGLTTRDGKAPDWFEIIGQGSRGFVKATAVIEGDSVVLSSPEVKKPVAMRFAWHRNAQPNLCSRDGLPVGAFRAGEPPVLDPLVLDVAESKEYSLVYDLNLGKLAHEIHYDVDRRSAVTHAFDRIAYFLELQKPNEPLQWVYVSMDAFTDDLSKIGVPTIQSKAKFQTKVTGMSVVSNVSGIATGGNLAGNIEFWSHNYGPVNSARIPNASSTVWDFGDQPVPPADGYGCMQVHNYKAKQTVFAINTWKSGPKANIGIGNSPGRTRDWTFVQNAGRYTVKRLRVLVREKK